MKRLHYSVRLADEKTMKVGTTLTIIQNIIDFILHIDEHLVEIIKNFGGWSYGIVFLIVFVETGIVIFPFLPGDSLLFASGALAAMGAFNIALLFIIFFIAAVLGDTVNYHIGKKVGTTISSGSFMGRLINQDKMMRAEDFFNKHGGKTIVIARFMPFIRTFIPFIAGASRMNYRYFLIYNVVGAVIMGRHLYDFRLFFWQYSNCQRQLFNRSLSNYLHFCAASRYRCDSRAIEERMTVLPQIE